MVKPPSTNPGLRRPVDFGEPGRWVSEHGLPVGGALLDAGGPRRLEGRWSCLGLEPAEVLVWDESSSSGDPFALLEALGLRHRRPACGVQGEPDGPEPVVVCALAYDLGRTLEVVPALAAPNDALPALWAAAYGAMYVWDRQTGRGEIRAASPSAADALHAALAAGGPRPATVTVGEPAPEMGWKAYRAAFERVQAHITAGDAYQINLTVRFRAARSGGDPVGFYERLARASPAPFGACLRLSSDVAVFSVSPERFLKFSAAGEVETCPIKGTRPRGSTPEDDQRQMDALLASEKDRAEHVMIVDLERNDLGRVCRIGTVEVPRLLQLETHPTVHHLVSAVRGRLRPDASVADLLRATFPGGSITGAPKIRAMEIIESLEPVRRGLYCGALGYLDAAGGGDLNIAIRTAYSDATALYYHAGGGLVAESVAEDEWDELQTKARAFVRACADQ